jgi:hypothetical protein
VRACPAAAPMRFNPRLREVTMVGRVTPCAPRSRERWPVFHRTTDSLKHRSTDPRPPPFALFHYPSDSSYSSDCLFNPRPLRFALCALRPPTSSFSLLSGVARRRQIILHPFPSSPARGGRNRSHRFCRAFPWEYPCNLRNHVSRRERPLRATISWRPWETKLLWTCY